MGLDRPMVPIPDTTAKVCKMTIYTVAVTNDEWTEPLHPVGPTSERPELLDSIRRAALEVYKYAYIVRWEDCNEIAVHLSCEC